MRASLFRPILLLLGLLPLLAPAADAPMPVASRVALPPLTLNSSATLYPAAAARAGLQGRVLVAFNISGRGRPDELQVEQSGPQPEFDAAALKLVRLVRFTVPKNWQDQSEAAHRFRLSVLFKLLPCQGACVAPVMHPEADDFLLITAERATN